MAEQISHPALSGGIPPRKDASSTRTSGQHPLSCTRCRQRKVKCNKSQPCLPCQRLGIECVFPERARHPKKKKDGAKTNEELLARLSRMEQLIGKMEGDGKLGAQHEPERTRSPPRIVTTEQPKRESVDDGRDLERQKSTTPSDSLDRYIGSSFWRSLTSEVEGLRQAVDDDSEDEGSTPGSTPSGGQAHSSIMFSSSFNTPQDLRFLHPPPHSITELCDIYASNVDPVFKVMHIPNATEDGIRCCFWLKYRPKIQSCRGAFVCHVLRCNHQSNWRPMRTTLPT